MRSLWSEFSLGSIGKMFLDRGGGSIGTKVSSSIKEHKLLLIVVCTFAATVLFVNPIRETAMEDDWAYALTVKRLIETGQYQLHDWAAANIRFQSYWAGFFARLLGFSFSTLRLSTVVLVFAGLVAFYCLATEHGLDHIQAGLMTFGLIASPLLLRFSFNFMSDVPFLMCVIISIFFYTRALRLRSYSLMLLGSVPAAAAVL